MVYGMMYIIVNSRKSKGKVFKEHVLKDIIPCCFDARVVEFQKENNRQWVTLEEAIQDRDDHIQAIQYENVALYALGTPIRSMIDNDGLLD